MAMASLILPSPSFLAPFKPRHYDKLALGIVGLGLSGQALLEALQRNCNVKVNCLCDFDDQLNQKLKAQNSNVPIYIDYRTMLEYEHDHLDALIVCAPDHSNAAIALAAMRLGKHVYIDGPMARSVAEVKELADYARAHKLITRCAGQAILNSETQEEPGVITDIYCYNTRSAVPQPTLEKVPAAPGDHHWDLSTGPLGQKAALLFNSLCRHFKLTLVPYKIEACSSYANYRAFEPNLPQHHPSEAHVVFHCNDREGNNAVRLHWIDDGHIKTDSILVCGDKKRVAYQVGYCSQEDIGQWLQAITENTVSANTFVHLQPATEIALLGNVALRTNSLLRNKRITAKFLYPDHYSTLIWNAAAFSVEQSIDAIQFIAAS